jgi:hypothetical protein
MRKVIATNSLTLDGEMQAPRQQGNGVRLHNGEFQDQDED